MKILHVIASPHLGGAERMCLWLAREQSSRGHEAAVLTFRPGDAQTEIERAGLHVFLPDLAGVNMEDRYAVRRAAAEALTKTTASFRPDVIHSHVPVTHLVCSRTLNRRWVATVHGSWKQFAYSPDTVRQPLLKPYLMLRHAVGDAWTLRNAARVAVPAQRTKALLERVGVSARKIRVIHNGLPPAAEIMERAAARAKMGIAPDAIALGGLGYFAPVKGFDLLVRAFATLTERHPTLQLLIAGGDVLGHCATRGMLEQLIARLGVAERVRLLGPLDPAAGFLASLDLFVVSSRSEGLPLALIQAMQHGLPSVVSSEGGSGEAARDGIESLVFPSGRIDRLAAALERLIVDKQLREAMGSAAAARASTYLTLQRCAEDYEQFYSEALGT
ncbi:MAG: glycosyltransferase [bacterium]|nr:glycosyltransferase [bacterium]